jgi:HAD superfamily hydrolase (TIGR01509 family)
VAIVSGAASAEIVPVVRAAGLEPLFQAIVPSDAVTHGKPDPEGYLKALELLGVPAGDAVAFEDTESGVASAKDAGMRCIAVRGTLKPDRLARADELIDALDLAAVRRLFDEQ